MFLNYDWKTKKDEVYDKLICLTYNLTSVTLRHACKVAQVCETFYRLGMLPSKS